METNYLEIRSDTLGRIYDFLKGKSSSSEIKVLVNNDTCIAAPFNIQNNGNVWGCLVSLNKTDPDNQVLQVWRSHLLAGKPLNKIIGTPIVTLQKQSSSDRLPVTNLKVEYSPFCFDQKADLESLIPLLEIVKDIQNAMTHIKNQYTTEAANEAKMVRVDPTEPFTFPKNITDKYGDYQLVPELQVNLPNEKFEFSIDDIMFVPTIVQTKHALISGTEARSRILDAGYIALDGHCAMVIFQNPTLLELFKEAWGKQYGGLHSGFSLDSILFLGSMATNDVRQHVICFEYDSFDYFKQPRFLPYEAVDKGWSDENSFAVVFKKEAVERLKRIA